MNGTCTPLACTSAAGSYISVTCPTTYTPPTATGINEALYTGTTTCSGNPSYSFIAATYGSTCVTYLTLPAQINCVNSLPVITTYTTMAACNSGSGGTNIPYGSGCQSAGSSSVIFSCAGGTTKSGAAATVASAVAAGVALAAVASLM